MPDRWVATRPDVPEGFDPGDLILARTAEERDQINAGIDRYVTAEEAETSSLLAAKEGD